MFILLIVGIIIATLVFIYKTTNYTNFRKTKWKMFKDQVKSIEIMKLIDESENEIVYRGNITDEIEANIIYKFNKKEQLVEGIIYLLYEDFSELDLHFKDYYFFKNFLTKQFGKPKKYKICTEKKGENVSIKCKWETFDTVIILFMFTDNMETGEYGIGTQINYIYKGIY